MGKLNPSQNPRKPNPAFKGDNWGQTTFYVAGKKRTKGEVVD